MVDEPIPTLDECSSDWRAIYFFRNSVKTILEIRSAIETLKREKHFMRNLSKQPKPLNGALKGLSNTLNRAHKVIKQLRNEVSGHLPHKAVAEALVEIEPTTEVLLQMGNTAKDIHYKFGLEFLGAIMLRHVSFQDAEKEWNTIIKTTLEVTFEAIEAIDLLFVSYSRIYGHRF